MVLALTGLWPPGVMLSSCRCGCVSEQKLNLSLRLCKDKSERINIHSKTILYVSLLSVNLFRNNMDHQSFFFFSKWLNVCFLNAFLLGGGVVKVV